MEFIITEEEVNRILLLLSELPYHRSALTIKLLQEELPKFDLAVFQQTNSLPDAMRTPDQSGSPVAVVPPITPTSTPTEPLPSDAPADPATVTPPVDTLSPAQPTIAEAQGVGHMHPVEFTVTPGTPPAAEPIDISNQ